MSSRCINRVTLLGHIGRDAETKYTPQGSPVTRFSLATTRRWKDAKSGEMKEDTTWTSVALWHQEKLAAFLLKGERVYVEGRLASRRYEKDGQAVTITDVVGEQVILLGSTGDTGNRIATADAKIAQAGDDTFKADDDVPF